MKHLFLIILSLGISCYGQDTTSHSVSKTKRFSLGMIVSPDICFRTLRIVDHSAFSEDVYKMDKDVQRAKLGFTAGLCLRIDLCKHFEIETGLLYSNKGFRTKASDLVFGDLVDRRRGFVYNTTGLPSHGKLVYTFNYFDLPVKINYLAGNKKLRFVCGAGLTLNFLLKATNSFKGTDPNGNSVKNSSTNDSYNSLNLSPCISAGINWRIKPRMELRIEPTFRYGLLKIIDAPVTAYLWNAGLNLSYSFRL